jgi:hypothetical protein
MNADEPSRQATHEPEEPARGVEDEQALRCPGAVGLKVDSDLE